MTPYYQDDLVTIYHGDARDHNLVGAQVLVTDPPYGRSYRSAKVGKLSRFIEGDHDTVVRDAIVFAWGSYRPAFIFGQWQIAPPQGTKAVLIWDAYPLGMGDTRIPWKPCAHEIYVLPGSEPYALFGSRDSCVLTGFAPVQSLARNGRTHPHEKPVELMEYLIRRTQGSVIDPFMGTGATLVAAKRAGRRAIGIEIEERYCEIAARRCSQEVLGLVG